MAGKDSRLSDCQDGHLRAVHHVVGGAPQGKTPKASVPMCADGDERAGTVCISQANFANMLILLDYLFYSMRMNESIRSCR